MNPQLTQTPENEKAKNPSPMSIGATFSLYELQEGGSALWTETQKVQLDEQGRYTVLLGATQPEGLPLDLFTSGKALWLGVQAQAPGAVEQPRVLLVAVPYALKASDSDTLGGKPASAYALAGSPTLVALPAASNSSSSAFPSGAQSTNPTTGGAPTAPQPLAPCPAVTSGGTATATSIAMFTTNCNIEASAITQTGGNIGISGASPANTKFQVIDTPAANFGTHYTNHELLNSSATVSGTNKGLTFVMDATNMAISAGVTDSGYRIGVEGAAYANTAGFAGTLGAQYGVWGRAGILGGTAPATVSNAYAGYFDIFNAVAGTTITNAYGVFIGNTGTTGTITNRYDLYASSANATSYFAGKVGIGTTTPAAKLEVNGTGRFDGSVTFAPGQLFPGTGTVTSISAGLGLKTAPAPITTSGTVSIDPTVVPQLGVANTFAVGPQTVATGDVAINMGNLDLAQTISPSVGVITMNKANFVHACCSFPAWNTFAGNLSGNFTVTGVNDSGFGAEALENVSGGSNNTAAGFQALFSDTTGFQNTAFGVQALQANGNNCRAVSSPAPNATSGGGNNNTAGGYQALIDNTCGNNNTAVGDVALLTNTNASFNTAVGAEALYGGPQSGSDDVGVGFAALYGNQQGSDNVAVGDFALYNNTTTIPATGGPPVSGNSNTAVGFSALIYNTTGGANVAVGIYAGTNAGDFPTTGSSSTYLGAYAGPTVDGLINANAVGYTAQVGCSNCMVLGQVLPGPLGNPSTAGVNVGIGITTPGNPLEVVGGTAGAVGGPPSVATALFNNPGTNADNLGDILVGQSSGSNRFRVDSNGKGFFDGGTQVGGADFAESFAVQGKKSLYEPGDLLVIDPSGKRRLALAHIAYSTLVAGIYSTKPGVLGTPHQVSDHGVETNEIPLAVVGVVPCKVTAANGPIRVGDLLVTSSRAGYAMKGTDRQRLVGAVVGKALEPLPKGSGVIQVLVTLQ